jgi:hypothetical protein
MPLMWNEFKTPSLPDPETSLPDLETSIERVGEPSPNQAIVIKIIGRRDTRFFAYQVKGRITTAWCLAGAKMFGEWDVKEITKAESLLTTKGYTIKRSIVQVAE